MEDINVKHEWQVNDDGDFAAFKVTITQEGREVYMQSVLPDVYKHNTEVLKGGMVFTMSSYYGGEPWLSKGKCPSGAQCQLGDVVFKNLVFSQTGADPAPYVPPVDYTYGDLCATPYDGDCGGCSDCCWSWPTDDPAGASSSDANCRCKPDSILDALFRVLTQ
jgi:hypothetical protein